jgi:ribosomal protein L37AE/L43A
MLSRNVYRRQDENSRYLRAKYKLSSRVRLLGERWKQRRDYKFFVCPSCHATLRVPKGRGKIKIVCRKCGTSFTGKS